MSGIWVPRRGGRAWRSFAAVMAGLAAVCGLVGSIAMVVDYHALTTRGVQTAATVESSWRVKSGWDCSVDFDDVSGTRQVETVSGCGNVQRGQTLSVTYDRSDPSTIAMTGSYSALGKLGLAAFIAVFSLLMAFASWASFRRPAWGGRRGGLAGERGVVTGSLSGSPAKRVRYRPRSRL